ncbi:hypothetical protein [uncultured Tateyamaria sp.]|uniref:hypothetical protein n=1 Tax=uncultured Tateyamaria sp. TaxID=455651 RepID=UPI0026086F72|nr:hypothetical protein [uncultured Tateyamaria sp.]
MKKRPNYLIFAPSFDPDSGGAIFLHQLAHVLDSLGEDVRLWPWTMEKLSTPAWLKKLSRKPSALWKTPKFDLNPELNTRIARSGDLRPDSIVVYPEVTLGNPLGARNVVRWLLYRPGLKDPYAFTENEMFFRAGEMSDLPDLTGGAPDLYVWNRNPMYRNEQRADRAGACYMVRKGHDKPRIPETENAICIDGMSHAEVAEVFNRCDVFYSYDEATMYSQFAAICGCLSVIVPGLYASRDDWVAAHPMGRYGVAYGLDDLDHARATQSQVGDMLDEKERDSRQTVEAFVARTQSAFGGG